MSSVGWWRPVRAGRASSLASWARRSGRLPSNGWPSGLTGQGMTLGTAGYIDPDVLDGSEPSVRSDVYSLGVVCYEALVGRPPFRGISELAVIKAADRGEFVAVRDARPDVPPALA